MEPQLVLHKSLRIPLDRSDKSFQSNVECFVCSAFPGEWRVKVDTAVNGDATAFDVWFADKILNCNLSSSELAERSEALARSFRIVEHSAKKVFLVISATEESLCPPITITRGVKVRVEFNDGSHGLGKVSRDCTEYSIGANIHLTDGTRLKDVPRESLQIMGRYRPGQFDKIPAQVVTGYLSPGPVRGLNQEKTQEHSPKQQNGLVTATTVSVYQRLKSFDQGAAVKIQTHFRQFLARKAVEWLRMGKPEILLSPKRHRQTSPSIYDVPFPVALPPSSESKNSGMEEKQSIYRSESKFDEQAYSPDRRPSKPKPIVPPKLVSMSDLQTQSTVWDKTKPTHEPPSPAVPPLVGSPILDRNRRSFSSLQRTSSNEEKLANWPEERVDVRFERESEEEKSDLKHKDEEEEETKGNFEVDGLKFSESNALETNLPSTSLGEPGPSRKDRDTEESESELSSTSSSSSSDSSDSSDTSDSSDSSDSDSSDSESVSSDSSEEHNETKATIVIEEKHDSKNEYKKMVEEATRESESRRFDRPGQRIEPSMEPAKSQTKENSDSDSNSDDDSSSSDDDSYNSDTAAKNRGVKSPGSSQSSCNTGEQSSREKGLDPEKVLAVQERRIPIEAPSRRGSDKMTRDMSPAAIAATIAKTGKISLYLCTYYCGGCFPCQDVLKELLQPKLHEIYAVGFQDLDLEPADVEAQVLTCFGTDYMPLRYCVMKGIHLFVIVHRLILPLIHGVESDHVCLGVAVNDEDDRKKGAVAACFRIGETSVAILNSHFRGKATNCSSRDANFHEINARLRLPGGLLKNTEPIDKRFDFTFWMGDLNYRVDIDKEEGQNHLENLNFQALRDKDQLLQNKSAFLSYSESQLNFPPTAKYLVGTDFYNDKSFPSWTDRILFSSDRDVEPLLYDAFDFAKDSTHRPVFALFRPSFLPPNKLRPDWAQYPNETFQMLTKAEIGKPQQSAEEPFPNKRQGSLLSSKTSSNKSTACVVM